MRKRNRRSVSWCRGAGLIVENQPWGRRGQICNNLIRNIVEALALRRRRDLQVVAQGDIAIKE